MKSRFDRLFNTIMEEAKSSKIKDKKVIKEDYDEDEQYDDQDQEDEYQPEGIEEDVDKAYRAIEQIEESLTDEQRDKLQDLLIATMEKYDKSIAIGVGLDLLIDYDFWKDNFNIDPGKYFEVEEDFNGKMVTSISISSRNPDVEGLDAYEDDLKNLVIGIGDKLDAYLKKCGAI